MDRVKATGFRSWLSEDRGSFCGPRRHTRHSYDDDDDGWKPSSIRCPELDRGFIFANLVDFDTLSASQRRRRLCGNLERSTGGWRGCCDVARRRPADRDGPIM